MYYHIELEHCYDVVLARDTTIARQKKIIALQERETKAVKTEKGIAIRLAGSLVDTVSAKKIIIEKQAAEITNQRVRKKRWRKIAIVSDVILAAEVVYLYTKQTLFKW